MRTLIVCLVAAGGLGWLSLLLLPFFLTPTSWATYAFALGTLFFCWCLFGGVRLYTYSSQAPPEEKRSLVTGETVYPARKNEAYWWGGSFFFIFTLAVTCFQAR